MVRKTPKNSPEMPNFYTTPETPELRQILQKADGLKTETDRLRLPRRAVWRQDGGNKASGIA